MHPLISFYIIICSACPRGWTGLLCEIPMMVCGGKGPATSVCLNGGICTPSRTSASDFYCDCSDVNPLGNHSKWNASKWNSSRWSDRMRHHGNWSFGGRSCQVPASTLCPVPVNEPNPLNFYCANGGTCPPISAYSTGYCTCPTGNKYFLFCLIHFLNTRNDLTITFSCSI